MNGKPFVKIEILARTAAAVGLLAATAPVLAVTDADFDREAQVASQQAQRQEIVVNPAVPAQQDLSGAAGRSAESALGAGSTVDTGSSQFNSYVEQVNQQLRIQREAVDPFSA